MSTRQVEGTYQAHWRGGVNWGTQTAVVGYESSRYCTVMYSFNTGNESNKPITGISVNWRHSAGQENYYAQGTAPTVYFYVTTSSNSSNHINPASGSPASDGQLIFTASPYTPYTNTVNKNLALNQTYYLYVFTKVPTYGWRFWVKNNIQITLTQIDYTNCGAPTSVTAPEIVTPTNITVSWSGAIAGTNNSIVGYDVYWNISADGTPPTTSSTNKTSVTTTSATINISGATRGYKVVFGIVTKGSAGNQYYSSLKVSSAIAINRLPTAPTPSVTQATIPSTSTGQTITVTSGTDADAGQTCTVYYTVDDPSDAKQEYTQALNVNSTVTYYFWTYDGLEYSEYSTCVITKNVKPIISILGGEVNNPLITALGNNGVSGNSLGYANIYIPKITCSKTGTLRWYIELKPDTSTSTSFSSDSVYNLPNQNIGNINTEITLPTVNTDLAVKTNYNVTTSYTFYKWRVVCILNDGIEDSDPKYFPTDSAKYYAVPGMSNIVLKSNNHNSDSNITGTISGHMYDKVRFKLYKDTSASTIEVIAVNNDVTLQTTTATSTSGNFQYINVTLNSIPLSGSTINFTITYSNSDITKTVTASMVECLHPSMSSFNFGISTFKPFTQGTGTTQASTPYPFGSYTLSSALSTYECSTTATSAIKLAISRSGKEQIMTASVTKSGDALQFTVSKSNIFTWDSQLGITNYSGTYNCQVRAYIENLYQGKFYSASTPITLNFNEAPFSAAIVSPSYVDGSSIKALGSKYVQEGMTVRLAATCSAYSKGSVTFSLYKNNVKINSKNVSVANSSTAKSASCSFDTYISEIADASAINWRIAVNNSTGTTDSNIDTKVLRHTTPVWSFDNCEVAELNNTYNLNFAYTISDLGIGVSDTSTIPTNFSQSYHIVDIDNSPITPSFSLSPSGSQTSVTCLSSASGWEAKSLRLEMVSSVATNANVVMSSAKTFYTNVLPVFKLAATVAYRKNHLGINTNSPSDDAILDIHQTTGLSRIYLKGIADASDVLWTLDIPKGTMAYSVTGGSSYTFDLYNGYYTRPQIDTMIGWVEESLLNLL